MDRSSPPAPTVPAGSAPLSGRRAALAAAAGVALVMASFFAPALLGDDDFTYRDNGRMHAPMKRWIASELAAGRLPQWNPYAGLGAPVVANATDAVQHPLGLALVLLPRALALKAWVLLSFALAAAGAHAWARALGRSSLASGIAALGFALSGPLVSSSDNVTYLTAYAALPWLFWAAHAQAERGGPAGLAKVGLASALCAAAGDPQAWGIAVGLLPLYALAVSSPGARRVAVARGILAAVAAAVAAAPFLVPVLAWLPHSQRAAGMSAAELTRWNLHPGRLAELLVPDLFRGDPADPLSSVFAAYAGNDLTPLPWFLTIYVGAAIAALALVAAARTRRGRLLVVGALLFGWAALGHHAGFGQLAARLPVLGALRYWEKLAVWLPLLLSAAAALGADELVSGRAAGPLARGAAAGAAVLLGLAALGALAPRALAAWVGGPADAAAGLAANLASGAARAGLALALLTAVAAAVSRGRLPRAAPIALFGVVALDLFGGSAGAYVLGPRFVATPPPLAGALPPGARVLTPFTARDDRWPSLGRLENAWEWSRRTLVASWNVPLGIGSDQDYVALREARWSRHRDALGAAAHAAHLGLFAFGYVVVPGRPENAARTGLQPPFRAVASDDELPAWLVAIPHRPRAYLAGELARADAAEALAFALGGGEDGRTVVEGSMPPGYAPAGGEARIVRDLPGDTTVAVRAGGPALLVLNDAFAPGWRATVDGEDAELVRVNGLVRGVWIGPSAREVRFRYRTPGLLAGWGAALAGALALAAWGLARRAR